jgi:hypothetical protein
VFCTLIIILWKIAFRIFIFFNFRLSGHKFLSYCNAPTLKNCGILAGNQDGVLNK